MYSQISVIHKQLKTPANFMIRPDTSDIKSVAQVYKIQSYRRKTFQVGSNEKWLDMGSNIGAFGVYAGQMGSEVIAFEAERQNADLTKMNLDLNNVRSRVIHAAIMPDSHDQDFVEFHVFQSNRPMAQRRHSIYQPKKDSIIKKVPAVRFGDCKKYGYDCIKMNIEGVEIPILVGDPDLSWVNKMVLEWSFDKEPRIEVLRSVLSTLKKRFRYVDINRSIKPDMVTWNFYPPNAFIYCIK